MAACAAAVDADLYAILGVCADVDGAALRAAFLLRAKATHPDRALSAAEPAEPGQQLAGATAAATVAAASFVRVRDAYELLNDPVQRRAYDATRAAEAQPVHPRAIADDVAASEMEWLQRSGEAACLRCDCRCGGEYTVVVGELAAAGADGLAAPCNACSLWVRVLGPPPPPP